jgi:hypothetical protein
MFRATLAGVMLALSASTAMATNISFGTPYFYETSSATSAASGTSVTPPAGGLGNVGGLCAPGVGGCPTISGTGPLTSGQITFNTPSLVPGTSYLLEIVVSDDDSSLHATGFPSNTPGDIFQVLLNGGSLGFTSITGVTDHSNGSFSTGTFQTVIGSGPGSYTIDLTDLLQPYANGLTDNLPGVLCGLLPNGTGGCSPSPVNGGPVTAAGYGSNIVDFEAFITPTAAPEPGSMILLGSGLLVLSALRRSRTR